MPEILGMQLDQSGSNISAFTFLFKDAKVGSFRAALIQAFAFAEETVKIAKATGIKHGLELWDCTAQETLHSICNESAPLFENAKLFLEKTAGGRNVWEFGISIFPSNTGRYWTLPDGLISSTFGPIALEFDHGNTIGHWATQLLKAIRSSASPKIKGVIFCYCSTDNKNWFEGEDFSDEFKAVLGTATNKPIGIITINQADLVKAAIPSKEEIAALVEKVYLVKRNTPTILVDKARQLIQKLRDRDNYNSSSQTRLEKDLKIDQSKKLHYRVGNNVFSEKPTTFKYYLLQYREKEETIIEAMSVEAADAMEKWLSNNKIQMKQLSDKINVLLPKKILVQVHNEVKEIMVEPI